MEDNVEEDSYSRDIGMKDDIDMDSAEEIQNEEVSELDQVTANWIPMEHNLEEEPCSGDTGIKADIDLTSEEMLYADHETKVSEADLVSAVRGSEPEIDMAPAPQTEEKVDDIYVWPWMGIVVNLPIELKDGKYVGSSGSKLKHDLTKHGFNPVKVRPLWNCKCYSGTAIVEFKKDWNGFYNAISFDKYFEADRLGKSDWRARIDHGSQIYGWVAQYDDYHGKGILGENLRKFGDLKTISGIEIEDKRKTNALMSDLSNVIEVKDKNIEEMKCKVEETSSALYKEIGEKEKLVDAYNEEIRKMQMGTQIHLKKILLDHEKRKSDLETQKKELEFHALELQKRHAQSESERRKLSEEKEKVSRQNDALQMATIAQKKADENVMRVVESHKLAKEDLHKRIINLEKELEAKQAVELEIEQLRGSLKVMNLIETEEDVDAQTKIKLMSEKLEEKEGELQYLNETQAALIVKEWESNNELVNARKELIKGFEEIEGDVGLKKMGDLDMKPFQAACKRKYHDEIADDKAVELCSLWDNRIRNPKWQPFKTVIVNGEAKEIADAEDKKLKYLKNEFGNEAYDAVATALLELNEYNASGRYPVPELWNFKEDRRATVKEGAMFIFEKWVKKKKKKRLTW
ncbi:Factor of dna methylation [Thalictrum thalictroides]|uniref:Factor of dna methylation n=1 Tax=Thalictrum thalictroides TaxID=46969 RepID=A0A7J6WSD4_THATH|nr:Factor of dna methylation [Thalictrum thalictroides]